MEPADGSLAGGIGVCLPHPDSGGAPPRPVGGKAVGGTLTA